MPIAIRYLSGPRVSRGLCAGIARVVARREYINRINVFPVPDGDTGTNMAFTLVAVLKNFRNRAQANVSQVLGDVADAALDSSRGNSGAILAQFLQGLGEGCKGRAHLSPQCFAAAVARGAEAARQAIAEPREGTMLSVIQDFATEVQEQVKTGVDDFVILLRRGLKQAKVSLAKTTSQLAVLQQAGVVDAGAQGFVDLLEGIHEFIDDGSIRDEGVAAIGELEDDEGMAAGDEVDLRHRFCTECVITGDDIDRLALRQRLVELDSSSLVIAGTQTKVRVHIHVNDPAIIFAACEEFGAVSSQKADDMQRQQHSAHSLRDTVAVITESAADIPDSEIERLNIHMIPQRLNFGDRDYLDKVSIGTREFYAKLRASQDRARTSQPPLGDFRRQFLFLSSHHKEVLSVNVSSTLSGTLQAAKTAAGLIDKNITIVDSLNVSAGQGLLVMHAAEAAQAGYTSSQIETMLAAMVPQTVTYGVLADLSYGVRGGRISVGKKHIADLLRVTPVIKMNSTGRVVTDGVLLGRRDIARRFANYLGRRLDKTTTWRVIVGHCDCPGQATVFEEVFRSLVPRIESLYVIDAGTAIGVHAGPGAVIVGLQPWQPIMPAKETPKDNND